MGESFLTSWPKHSRIELGRQERREEGGKMQETRHVELETKDACSLVWNRGECADSCGRNGCRCKYTLLQLLGIALGT